MSDGIGIVELLPCPFCGGSDLIRGVRYAKYSDSKDAAVRCQACDCNVPLQAWNTRATPPAAPSQSNGDEGDEFFQMLWNWFEHEDRIGAEGMRPERTEGLSADDFKTMLDEHETALTSEITILRAQLAKATAALEEIADGSSIPITTAKNALIIIQEMRS